MNALIQKAQIFKIGKQPVVVLPVSVWNNIRGKIEEMQEDIEMYTSKNYKNDIASARASKKEISSTKLYKKLGLI